MVLGYDNLENYISNPKFFGATIGPNCNSISNACFTLNNIEYNLEKNDNISKKINSQINEKYEQVLLCVGYDHNFIIVKK